jgi:hypothetical protein
MKLFSTCFKCMQEGGDNFVPQIISLIPQDSGLYRFRCAVGHDGAVILQERHFQLLFEIGLCALRDGYPREAIADFTASLERFYEFYFRLISKVIGIDQLEVDNTWRSVAAQSERQIGLYLATYVAHEGRAPAILSPANTSLRNAVIHKGKIPSRAEAVAFGEAVRGLVQPVLSTVVDRYSEALQSDTFHHMLSQNAGFEQAATMSYPTTLTLNREVYTKSLEDRIRELSLPPWS